MVVDLHSILIQFGQHFACYRDPSYTPLFSMKGVGYRQFTGILFNASGETPGDQVEIRADIDGELLASGEIDLAGGFQYQWPASKGSAHHFIRRPFLPARWSSGTQVAPGSFVLPEGYGGRMLKCVIGGITAATEPDEKDILLAQQHCPVLNGQGMTVIPDANGVGTRYGYTANLNNVSFDLTASNWDLNNIVELAGNHYA